jgi:hypothetical protein
MSFFSQMWKKRSNVQQDPRQFDRQHVNVMADVHVQRGNEVDDDRDSIAVLESDAADRGSESSQTGRRVKATVANLEHRLDQLTRSIDKVVSDEVKRHMQEYERKISEEIKRQMPRQQAEVEAATGGPGLA